MQATSSARRALSVAGRCQLVSRRDGLAAWACGLLLGIWLLMPVQLYAHRLNNSRMRVRVTGDSLRLQLAVDESDLVVAFPLDRNADGVLWRNEMIDGIPEVAQYAMSRLRVEADGAPVSLVRRAAFVDPDGQGNLYLNLVFSAALDEPPASLDLYVDLFDRFSEGHKNLTTVEADGGTPQLAVFSAKAKHHRFALREESIPGTPIALAAGVTAAIAGLVLVGLRRRKTPAKTQAE